MVVLDGGCVVGSGPGTRIPLNSYISMYMGGPNRNETSLKAAERGGVVEGRQCFFPRPSTVSSGTDVFL